MKEHDRCILTKEVPESNLKPGDIGVVVCVHGSGEGYEVEFMSTDGNTIAVLTLEATDVRPVSGDEILHARKIPA